jgi:hypothetical protein
MGQRSGTGLARSLLSGAAMKKRVVMGVAVLIAACGPDVVRTGDPHSAGGGAAGGVSAGGGGSGGNAGSGSAGSGGAGGSAVGGGGGTPSGCEGEPQGCYTIYAHGDHTLYSIDLLTKGLKLVGPFQAPAVGGSEDVITDLAVAPSGTIYVVSHTTLYTADPNDGHVSKLGTLGACGQDNVALSFTPDDKLYVADFKGQFCEINYTANPPVVTPIAKLSAGLAVSGDLVAVRDGTLYASAYKLSDAAGQGTQANNVLVKIDPATATVTTIGSTGSPKLFGVAYALGKVFGFTHDGTGHVVTLDPATGTGTLFNTFTDPSTHQPISFAGAGVNALVPPTIN